MTFKDALGRAALVAGLLLATSAAADEAATLRSTGGAAPAVRSASPGGALPADDAILKTLKNAKPMPVPKAPKESLSAWRSEKHANRAADFGTVTRILGDGGKTSTKAPSKEIEQSLENESALPAPEDGGNDALRGEVETGPMTEPGAQAERKVFGPDDRVHIEYTKEYPFRTIGLVQVKFPGDGDIRHFCSGSLISPRSVLTAAHCLYDIERGLWPEEVLFFPGLDGDEAPFGYYPAERVDVLAGYVGARTKAYDWQHVLTDMGLVRLEGQAGLDLGTLGYGYNDSLPPFVGNIVGYPMDMPLGTMWRASCNIDPVKGYPSVFETRCDTFQGSSGSSIYDFDRSTSDRTVYGVNVAENPEFNTGVRITGPYYQWIRENVK